MEVDSGLVSESPEDPGSGEAEGEEGAAPGQLTPLPPASL